MAMMDSIQELVELQGDAVRNGKQECADWHLTHDNCSGCPQELGCGKAVSIGLTIMASDESNGDKIQKTIDRLLASKSITELKAIRIPEMSYY